MAGNVAAAGRTETARNRAVRARFGALLLCCALLGGCAATRVIPPATPAEPTAVFLLDHGRHSTLILPHGDGMVRYAYGDWNWYAKVETGVFAGSSAVLFPSRAALGRRVLKGPATVGGVRRHLAVGFQHIHPLTVEAARAEALRRDLDALFFASAEAPRENTIYDLAFVPHPRPYSAFENSNHEIAKWLRELGCEVEGTAFWANWRVEAPE